MVQSYAKVKKNKASGVKYIYIPKEIDYLEEGDLVQLIKVKMVPENE